MNEQATTCYKTNIPSLSSYTLSSHTHIPLPFPFLLSLPHLVSHSQICFQLLCLEKDCYVWKRMSICANPHFFICWCKEECWDANCLGKKKRGRAKFMVQVCTTLRHYLILMCVNFICDVGGGGLGVEKYKIFQPPPQPPPPYTHSVIPGTCSQLPPYTFSSG